MLFNSFVFLFVFLPITYTVFWKAKSLRARHVWLAITGYVFYGYWNPKFCLLMAFSTAVSYTAGLGFLRYDDPRARRLLLVVPITVDLALLAVFKYADFVIESLNRAGAALGNSPDIALLHIVLPVGISFYTFHTITYIVDSYRGTIRPTRSLPEFAAYVSLFSQLVAGPIVRFRQIEADLEHLDRVDRRTWLTLGVSYFAYGMVEKVVIADRLAAFVDPALAEYASLSTAGAWLAMLGYTFQLYFDFCGYSDMAIGLGYMFGVRIPINFNSPYKALDISDFWRRWHISLSSCLRDYLYIPLGGSRFGDPITYRNLMITMLLGGLWHGANWTFVAWGAYHGLLLIVWHRWGRQWSRLPASLRQLATFVLVVFGWTLFRSTDFAMAADLLRRMVVPTVGATVSGLPVYTVLLAISALWAMRGPNAQDVHGGFVWTPAKAYALAAGFGVCVALIAGAINSPFLYFQF